MFTLKNKKAQAAIELAVFGSILIFILGTIVRSAVNNAYSQNENFKAMRMAMYNSWEGSEQGQGFVNEGRNISRNNATVLFVEDRLSADFNKYGDLDRNPLMAEGSGTFSYNLLYPWDPDADSEGNLDPVMDVYINGQYFTFLTAKLNTINITQPVCGTSLAVAPNVAQANCIAQCAPSLTKGQCAQQCQAVLQSQCLQNQCLRNAREWATGSVSESQFTTIVPVSPVTNTAAMYANASQIFTELASTGFIGNVEGTDLTQGGSGLTASTTTLVTTASLASSYSGSFPNLDAAQLQAIQTILKQNPPQYKLFYAPVVNGGGSYNPGAPDAMFDLGRIGVLDSTNPTYVPPGPMRQYMAWQWSTVPATSNESIGLDETNNQYPQLDVDGRLKEVTVYNLNGSQVTILDPQAGDIDSSWDINSCGPKPGLQSNAQIFTFTQAGTYLQILEGKLYNPENGQFVRSQNRNDTVDLIQRTIQLSNNTGRFCDSSGNPSAPVEICVPGTSNNNCFSSDTNIKSTCYDESDNRIFVRSRLQNQSGHAWITNASGQLQVQ